MAGPPPPPGAPRVLRQRVLLPTIAAGGIVGAEARYGLGVVWPHSPDGFPGATLVANLGGCLLIGVLMVVLLEVADHPPPLLRPLLGVGVLGGYTTFSTFAVDAVTLVRSGHAPAAAAYLVGTVVGGMLAVTAGVRATRAMARRRRVRRRGRTG
jgi:fluoride exporter